MVQKTISIPSKSVGFIIGKKGSNISRVNRMPGITSVKLNSSAYTVTVSGTSLAAVDAALVEVKKLAIFSISKGEKFHPNFVITCYQAQEFTTPCIRLERLYLSQKLTSAIFPSYDPIRGDQSVYLWYPADDGGFDGRRRPIVNTPRPSYMGAKRQTQITSIAVNESMTPETYTDMLFNCLSEIGSSTPDGTIVKLDVKLGKSLFLSETGALGSSDPQLPLGDVDLMTASSGSGVISRKFCDTHTSEDLRRLSAYLNHAGYSKLPVKFKGSIHLVDFRLENKHAVSLRLRQSQIDKVLNRTGFFDDSPVMFVTSNVRTSSTEDVVGENETIDYARFLRFPNRRGFVISARPGKVGDLRMVILTREMETAPVEELRGWIESAWVSRTAEGMLQFDPEGRFHVSGARYKEVHKFEMNGITVRVAKVVVCSEDGVHDYRWEVVLQSAWLKTNAVNRDQLKLLDMDEVTEKVESLFEEGSRIVEALGELHLYCGSI